MCLSGRQSNDFGTLSSWSVAGSGWWCSRPRSHRLWSRLFALGKWGHTCSFVSAVCLRIVYSAILEWKASSRVVVTKHSWVSFYRSVYNFIPRWLNTPLLLVSDLGARFLEQILGFLYCGSRKPSMGHFGHIPSQTHVGPFQLYTTSLPCHRSRHVEYLQEIRCGFKQWDAAITSTIHASVASL